MASDTLQLVVDMPEDEDLIWQAYQDADTSDDEEQARTLEATRCSYPCLRFVSVMYHHLATLYVTPLVSTSL